MISAYFQALYRIKWQNPCIPIYPVQVSVVIVINVSAFFKPTTQGGAKDVVTEKDKRKKRFQPMTTYQIIAAPIKCSHQMLICYLQTLESYNIRFLCILNNSGTEEILLTKSACPLPTSFAATPPSLYSSAH